MISRRHFMQVAATVAPLAATPLRAADAMLAIDILIEPDAEMLAFAKEANAKLRQDYSQGYAFDATHAPHISLAHRFIRASDLDAVAKAISSLATSLPLALNASGLIAGVQSGLGLLLCKVDRTPALLALENAVIAAVQPFAVSGGTADAFVQTPGEAASAETVAYVEHFVPASSGDKFFPHVTLGTAHPDFAKAFAAEPFTPFAFIGARLAIYQLGNFGTARRKLWPL